MKSLSALILLSAAALPVCGAAGTEAPANWKIFRESAGEFTVRYPSSFKPIIPKGSACMNGVCHPIEQTILLGREGSITFAIQRDINPKHLSVRAWYESSAHRPLNASSERIVALADRNAIRRGSAPVETVHMIGGKVVSRGSGLSSDDTIFVPLNDTDILTIALHPKSEAATGVFDQMLQTIRVSR